MCDWFKGGRWGLGSGLGCLGVCVIENLTLITLRIFWVFWFQILKVASGFEEGSGLGFLVACFWVCRI